MVSESRIREMLARGPFALIGAGQLGRMALDLWPEGEPKPLFFVDSMKSGDYCGLPVYRLDGEIPGGVTYLMSALKMPPATALSIFERLGQADILTVYDFLEERIPAEFSNGWRKLDPDAATMRKADIARAAYADDLSRLIHDCTVDWRYHRKLRLDYPIAPEEEKYNPAQFGRGGRHYDLLIDCGSYNLGSVASLSRGDVSFARIAAFEPDPAAFAACEAALASGKVSSPVKLYREALADFDGEATFLASGLFSARLIDPSYGDPRKINVPVRRLDSLMDELLQGATPGSLDILLKLHVEGAEMPALKGAEALLAAGRVDVVVDLAHDEASFLEVAAYLAGFGHFDVFLRSHALYGAGGTLFARYKDTA